MSLVNAAIAALALAGAVPFGLWLRNRRSARLWAWAAVGLLPFIAPLDLALASWDMPGDVHGLEVSFVDWLALSLLWGARPWRRQLPYRAVICIYLLVAVLTVSQAGWKLAALGYPWTLARMWLLYAAIWRSGRDPEVPMALLRGFMLGLVYEGALAVWQRFGLGVAQVTGSFGHQNTLGSVLNLTAMVALAAVLAGRATRLTKVALAFAALAAVLTASRATVLLFGAGGCLVYALSMVRAFTGRKALIASVGLLAATALVPVALGSFSTRTPEGFAESDNIRRQYEAAARMMVNDHPLGVGPNHFTVMLSAGGYGERAGLHWTQRVAIVHNIYWLTAAEMGYAGALALALLFIAPLYSAFRTALVARSGVRGDLQLGMAVGLLLFYVHGSVEWVWRQAQVTYLYWMTVGVVATLAYQVRVRVAHARVTVAPACGRHGPAPSAQDIA